MCARHAHSDEATASATPFASYHDLPMGQTLSSHDPSSTNSAVHLTPHGQPAITRHINDLPLELLQEILVCAAFLVDEHRAYSFMGERYEALDDSRSDLYAAWNWLDVMAVCRLWQKAANESPWFHSRVALQNRAAMARSMTLSRQLPLRVISGFAHRWNKERLGCLAGLLNDVLPRVCEIDLLAQPETLAVIRPVVISVFDKPAPILQRLRLRCYLDTEDGGCEIVDAALHDATKHPLLQDVDLDGLEFTQMSPLLSSSLRSLSLPHCRLFHGSNADSLQELLSNMPLLEVIDLRGATLADLAEPRRISLSKPPARFERLRRLTVEAPYLSVYRFLDLVSFPTTTVVEVHFQNVTSTSLKLGPPDKVLDFYKRHLEVATAAGSGYSRVGAHLDISLFDGELSYAWTFSHPYSTSNAAPLPDSMTVKWTFSIRRHKAFPMMTSFVKSVVELIPHVRVPHTLHFLQSGSFKFARWRCADEEQQVYDCWFEPCGIGLATVTELWLVGGATLDALYWFGNESSGRGWHGRSDYPSLKVLGFRSADMHPDVDFVCEKTELINGLMGMHSGCEYVVKLRNCEASAELKEELAKTFGVRFEIIE